MPDDAGYVELLATLRLLFGSHDREVLAQAINEAMVLPENERRRLICPHCGNDNLTFRADVTWDSNYNHYDCSGDNIDQAWCDECDGETHDSEVAFDYVHPNKSLDETHG